MQMYPFLISHCKNNRPLFTDRFPLYTNTDREIVTRKREEECELEGGRGCTVVHSETKKAVAVSKECTDGERTGKKREGG